MFSWIFLFVLGAVFGSIVNFAADVLGWTPKHRSPWRRLPSGWLEYVPILGYSKHRQLRLLVVELTAAAGTVWLWYWEITDQSLLPAGLQAEPFNTLALRFAVHIVFFTFLAVATLTDIDDMVISDVLTIAGTFLGLMFAVTLPQTRLPAAELKVVPIIHPATNRAFDYKIETNPVAVPLNVYSPLEPERNGSFTANFLLLTTLWLFWCFAMLTRVWYFKLPFRKAAAIFCRYLRRSPTTPYLAAAAVAVPAGFWLFLRGDTGSARYLALLSALTGCVAGMLIIWGVRIIGSAVLGREAMGFGDVTLMGMIGAFVGWQSCILIFFLAPFAGLFLGIINAVLGKGKEFPYGPFLCLATVFLIVAWKTVWETTAPFFELGWLIAAGMGVCLLMLGVLLGFWRYLREKFLW